MKLRSNIFAIENWVYNPARRKCRYRCQTCMKLVPDGSHLVVERRGKTSHGYHSDCFNSSFEGVAALARETERMGSAA